MIILLVTSIARRGAARCRKLIKVSLPLSFVSRRTTWTLKLGSLRHVPRRCSAGLKPITRPLAWTHLHASRTVIPVLMPVYRPLSIGRRSRVSKYCSADIDRLTPTIMLDRFSSGGVDYDLIADVAPLCWVFAFKSCMELFLYNNRVGLRLSGRDSFLIEGYTYIFWGKLPHFG